MGRNRYTNTFVVLQISGVATTPYVNDIKGGNPLSFTTEIIIEIKQFNFGRMASHPFIEGI